MALEIITQGTVTARRQIDLVAQVGGRVESVADAFADGNFFSQDDILLQVEQQDYRFAIQRAKARVADARQLLAQEKGRVRQARREWRELGDRDANELFLRKPQLASAQAALAAAQADLEQAELNLQRTTVRAPFSGRILEKFVDLGQFLAPGTPLARIYSTDSVEVKLPLTDRQVGMLDPVLLDQQHTDMFKPIPVVLQGQLGGERWQWQGSILRTDGSIDTRSRIMYAVAEIPDPFVPEPASGRPPLLIGQFVQASIAGREQDNALALPRSALRSQNTLWLLDDDDRLQVAPVNVLQSGAEQVVVQGDFDGSLRIIVSPLTMAIPGMPLRPKPATGQQGE
jgi:RND family efflux transporter MFP subunit